MKNQNTLVYSCSGCSSAAQMANQLALCLHRTGEAEMSCIAGVGGGVKPLVAVAQSGRKILALDGCPLQCVKHCLAQHQVEPTAHVVLSEWGVKKKSFEQIDSEELSALLDNIRTLLKRL